MCVFSITIYIEEWSGVMNRCRIVRMSDARRKRERALYDIIYIDMTLQSADPVQRQYV